jgi:hypothetical protein
VVAVPPNTLEGLRPVGQRSAALELQGHQVSISRNVRVGVMLCVRWVPPGGECQACVHISSIR